MTQKDAVVAAVKTALPSFVPGRDVAVTKLTNGQLEQIKHDIGTGIINGTIDYGKDRLNTSEVMSYARSMVMNHLKKAKELNGGQVYKTNTSNTEHPLRVDTYRPREKKVKGVDLNLLDDELKAFVLGLV